MPLKPYIYEDEAYSELSIDEAFTNPLKTAHDGKNGSTSVKKVFLRNTDDTKYYTDIRVFAKDSDSDYIYEDIVYNETGWGVKLSEGNSEPSDAEWEDISWGNAISIPNIGSADSGDQSTYRPFWALITCPPSAAAQNKKDIQLVVDYIERAV